MCGIAGFVVPAGRALPPERARSLSTILRHRGPDAHGLLVSYPDRFDLNPNYQVERQPEAVLLHRRLSILDLSDAGRQPMGTPDGRFFLVFNGEIYNYLELRDELAQMGHAFVSNSDSEVLLHAYAEWGVGCLNRLVGMFAFAVLDRRQRTLFLARDFFGIKPLYYTQAGGIFAFASELKALLDLPWVPHRAHAARLYEFLTTGKSDYGTTTFFADISQLPSAHYLVVPLDRPDQCEPIRYWRLDMRERLDISYEEAVRRVRELFLDNIRLHLRSDVPIGAALSGGIDSSAIVGAMRFLAPRLELHAFSYVAEDPALSEEKWIDIAAASSSAVLHKVRAGPDELLEDLERLIYSQDEPFASTSIYAQHRVFRLAREAGIPVMLDGQGADEMLGGYRSYLAARLASLVRRGHWLEASRFLIRLGKTPALGGRARLLLQTAGLLAPPRLKALAKQILDQSMMPPWLDESWFAQRGVQTHGPWRANELEMLRYKLQETLLESSLPMLLRYEDRNSMAHSIESRVPFLTPTLAGFLLRLPEDYIIGNDGTSKRVFRDAMRGLIPDAILDRKDKIGFATPEKRWLGHLGPWVEKTLRSDAAHRIPAFRPHAMAREWREIRQGNTPFDFRVWRWVNVIRWADRFAVSFN